MNRTMEELDKLVDDMNIGVAPFIKWAKDNEHNPFFETENGKELRQMLGDLAGAAALINLKMARMLMESALLEMKARAEEKDD